MANILLVENDVYLSEVLGEILFATGHNVTVAQNGKDAVNVLQFQNYDVIVSDMEMPIMTGIELLQWVRTSHLDTPFILISGFTRLLELIPPSSLGAQAFLAKPFASKDLVTLVQTVLETNLDKKFIELKSS